MSAAARLLLASLTGSAIPHNEHVRSDNLALAPTTAGSSSSPRRNGAVFVTINRTHYVALAAYGRPHPGVIILPSVAGRELARLFRRVLPVAERVFRSGENMFVEIDARERITSFRLP